MSEFNITKELTIICKHSSSNGTRKISGTEYFFMVSNLKAWMQSHPMQPVLPLVVAVGFQWTITSWYLPLFCVESETESFPDAPCSSLSLTGWRFADEDFFQNTHLSCLNISEWKISKFTVLSFTRLMFTRTVSHGSGEANLFSLALPVSMTKTTSGMVMPVSAMLVAMTILRHPGGGTSNASLWSCDVNTEWSGITLYLSNHKVTVQIHKKNLGAFFLDFLFTVHSVSTTRCSQSCSCSLTSFCWQTGGHSGVVHTVLGCVTNPVEIPALLRVSHHTFCLCLNTWATPGSNEIPVRNQTLEQENKGSLVQIL